MAVVLVTGMSGSGKSSVVTEVIRRGHAAVDTDEGDWIERVPVTGRRRPEPLWRADRITALLDAHVDGHLVIAGTVANQGQFYPRFDAVVLLSAPVEVLLARVATRTTNAFGKTAAERAQIIADSELVVPLLRARATVEVDARLPLAHVVDAVLGAARG